MPSTYTTNLGIEKIATGEQSGTWGTTTNTNLDLIDEAVNGVEQVTLSVAGSSGSPNNLPVTNGASSDGRNKFIEFIDGGDLGGTAYVQLTPNDAEKVVHIRNSLSAARNIIIFQGTYNASNDFEIPNGADVVLKFDGAGAGAVVSDVNVNLTPTKLTTATADITTGNITTVNATTVDSTNLEVTNLKAKDGTSAGSIADSTGVVTLASSVLTTTDINGGSVDGATLGTNSAITEAQIDNINIDGNAITSTDTNGNIALTPDGTGEVDISKVDIDSGTIDSTTIGGSTPAAGSFTTLNTSGAVVFNEAGADVDFRVESDTDTHALFVEGSSGNVGIGTSSPAYKLDINDGVSGSGTVARFWNDDVGGLRGLEFIASTGADPGSDWTINASSSGGVLGFAINETERMRIDSSGNIIHTGGSNGYIQASGTSNAYLRVSGASINEKHLDFYSATTKEFEIFLDGNDNFIFRRSPSSERMRIDSSGNVGIGTSSFSTGTKFGVQTGSGKFEVRSFGAASVELNVPTNGSLAYTVSSGSNGHLWYLGTSEAMRLDDGGNFLVGKTSAALDTQGTDIRSNGQVSCVRDGNTPFFVNRLTSDGTLIDLRQETAAEGSISVSGTTVSYNGGHLARWSRLADDSKDTSIVKGTVMTNLDAMVEWSHDAVEAQDAVYDDYGNLIAEGVEAKEAYTEENEQLNKMAVSSVEGDANVAGVFVNWDDDDDFNDMNIAMTGDMVIRIAQGTTVARGDLLMSAGDGTAKPQGDDIVRSKTIAKVTSTHISHTYDDGSYLVPCVLMAC